MIVSAKKKKRGALSLIVPWNELSCHQAPAWDRLEDERPPFVHCEGCEFKFTGSIKKHLHNIKYNILYVVASFTAAHTERHLSISSNPLNVTSASFLVMKSQMGPCLVLRCLSEDGLL